MSGFKKCEIDKHINLKDVSLFKENKKPIRTKNELAKRLKEKFPKSKHLYRQILRLETEPFQKRFNKELVLAICEMLDTTIDVIMVDVEPEKID